MAKELKQYEKEIFVVSKASPRFQNEHVLIPDTASNDLIFFIGKHIVPTTPFPFSLLLCRIPAQMSRVVASQEV